MTSNQIAARAAKETERANRTKEKENERSNRATEKLTRDRNKQDWSAQMTRNTVKLASSLLGGAKGVTANDPKWYNLDPQMVKDAASISYDTPLGYQSNPGLATATFNLSNPTANGEDISNLTVPGVVCFDYVPTLGNVNTVQTAALNIYAYVRHANSGSRNYEYQDLMKYLYAVDSVYIGIAELKRIYALLNTYKGYNKYYAEGYLSAIIGEAGGVKINNLNLAALRYYINNLVTRVNALYVPNVMSMFERHTWMSSTIWKDHPIKRSQNYMFSAKYLYKYDEDVDSTSFGSLVPMEYKNKDLEVMINNITRILDALLLSEDIGIMSGDILKAYGSSNMYMVQQIPEDHYVEEMYSEEVLSQITSATVLGPSARESFLIYEDAVSHSLKQGFDTTKLPISGFNITGNGLPFCSTSRDITGTTGDIKAPSHKYGVISMYKDEVTPDDNMVASRLIVATDYRSYKSSDNKDILVERILTNGTEIVSEMRMVLFQIDTTSRELLIEMFTMFDGLFTESVGLQRQMSSALSTFDWMPYIRMVAPYGAGAGNTNTAYINRDLANFAIVQLPDLDRLHRVAVNSELGVPLLGIQVRR